MDVIAAIQENITNWGQTAINVGVDFIYQKLFRPVYNVPGIGYADIKVAVTDDLTTPLEDAYVSDNITIEEVEIAVIDKSRIVVQEIAP
jgi:hypothetical protein